MSLKIINSYIKIILEYYTSLHLSCNSETTRLHLSQLKDASIGHCRKLFVMKTLIYAFSGKS